MRAGSRPFRGGSTMTVSEPLKYLEGDCRREVRVKSEEDFI